MLNGSTTRNRSRKIGGRPSSDQVNAAASFVLLVGIAIGAIVVAGIGRIVGWGSCP